MLRYSLPPYINNNSGISPSANPTISANSLRNILSIIFYQHAVVTGVSTTKVLPAASTATPFGLDIRVYKQDNKIQNTEHGSLSHFT